MNNIYGVYLTVLILFSCFSQVSAGAVSQRAPKTSQPHRLAIVDLRARGTMKRSSADIISDRLRTLLVV